jgi:protein TonB
MTHQITARYGAIELRSLYPTFALRGLFFAALFHLVIIAGYYCAVWFAPEETPPPLIHIDIMHLQPPPSTHQQTAPAVSVSAPAAHPANAIPVMVPDAEITPETTIATQEEIDRTTTDLDQRIGENGNVVIDTPPAGDNETEPPPFQPIEKPPVPVVNPAPEYPLIPLRAGIEGTVWVSIWVTKEGKAKKAQVVKTDSDLFNQAATDAAMKWVFTPAVMNNGPVAVWVTIPFRFALRNNR